MRSFYSNDLYGEEIKTILPELDLKRFHVLIEMQQFNRGKNYKQWMKEFIDSDFQVYIQLINSHIKYIPLCAFGTKLQNFIEIHYHHFVKPLSPYELLYLLKYYTFSIYCFHTCDYISSTEMFLCTDLPALR